MKLLITGASGQLGQAFVRLLSDNESFSYTAYSHREMDICSVVAVDNRVERDKPDVIINAAAYTAVDRAEDEVDQAFAVNRDGPGVLAKISAEAGLPIIHYSTDYVFDGEKASDWTETDTVSPLGVYGSSKLAGENVVRELNERHIILRTSWVFSPYGNNFVKTMLRLGKEREVLTVVNDQFGKPTCALEIARITLEILPRITGNYGIYNLAQPETTSWFEFARSIFKDATDAGIGLTLRELQGIPSSKYPTIARRPKNSSLATEKLEDVFNISMQSWKTSLTEVISGLAGNE